MYGSLYDYFMRNSGGSGGDWSKCLNGKTMKDTPTQKELTTAVKDIWNKLGGTVSLVLLAVLPSFADLSLATQWHDVPPTNTLGDVLALSTNSSATGVSRYLAPWDCMTGKPAITLTNMAYKAGDAYIVSNVKGGAAVYKHSVVMSGLADDDSYAFADITYYFTNGVASAYTTLQPLADAMQAAGIGAKGYNSAPATGTITKGTIVIAIDHVCTLETPASIALLKENSEHIQESQGIVSSLSSLSDTVTLIGGGDVNYRPSGSSYTQTASTVVESQSVGPNDTYWYDGSEWKLLSPSTDFSACIQTNALSGHTFDFGTMSGVYSGLKAVIEKMGGAVTNSPSN